MSDQVKLEVDDNPVTSHQGDSTNSVLITVPDKILMSEVRIKPKILNKEPNTLKPKPGGRKGPLICPHCKVQVMMKKSLTAHIARCGKNDNRKDPVCKICNATVRYHNYTNHMKSHNPHLIKHDCDKCHKQFKDHTYLKQHKLMAHSGSIEQVICPTCGSIFKNPASLNHHLKRHENREFRCDVCGKTYKDKGTLQEHLNIHNGVNPYKCDYCEEWFPSAAKRSVHRFSSHVPNRFSCDKCNKSYKLKKNMLAHMRIHTGEQPYACKECEKRFRSAESLMIHSRIHTDEYWFFCPVCNKGFNQKYNMIVHSKIHLKPPKLPK